MEKSEAIRGWESLNRVGQQASEAGNLDEAEKFAKEALTFAKSHLEPNDWRLGTSLSNVGVCSQVRGSFIEARGWFLSSLEILTAAADTPAHSICTVLLRLGEICTDTGEYVEADAYFQRFRVIERQAQCLDPQELATALCSYGRLRRKQGRFWEAEQHYEKALKIQNDTVGPEHLAVAHTLTNIGVLKRNYDDLIGAEAAYARALMIRERHLPQDHRDTASTRHSLRVVYLAQRRYRDAESVLMKALPVREKFYGADHPMVGATLNCLGRAALGQGRDSEGESFLRRALAIRESRPDTDPLETEVTVSNLAALLHAQRRVTEAHEYYERSAKMLLEVLRTNFADMSELDKLQFLYTLRMPFFGYFSFVYEFYAERPELVESMYELVLARKAMVGANAASLHAKVLAAGDEECCKLLGELCARRREISSLVHSPWPDRDSWRRQLRICDSQISDIERAISRRLQDAPAGVTELDVRWSSVQDELKTGEAAIEFVRFPFFNGRDWTGEAYYIALVLTDNGNGPRLVPLGPAGPIEQEAWADYERWTARPSSGGFDPDAGHAYYQILWNPLELLLKSSTRVYVAPDGILNQVALGIVRTPGGQLLSDRWDMRILTSTRDLLRPVVQSKERTAVIIGDAKLSGQEPLPHTREEIEGISLLLKSKGWDSTLFEGERATAEALESVKHPRLLHLSTHGAFSKDPTASISLPYTWAERDPMLRSHLSLSSAGGDTTFTALQAEGLDLHGTELVVLSACLSGIGQEIAADGVFGLRRAFQIAGADAVMVAMWSVPDEQTKELMMLFYDKWLDGKDKHQALREAQQELRAATLGHRNGPYHWGGFILVGR